MKSRLPGSTLAPTTVSFAFADTYCAECFAPTPGTTTISYPAKDDPYKITFANGFAENA